MSLNADHFFQIGTGHKVCQDFALSGVTKDFAYAIVCDGCSGSKCTETGAQILAYSARDVISERLFEDSDYNIGHVIIRIAEQRANFLPKCSLDATLQLAICNTNGKFRIIGFGDGAQCVLNTDRKKELRSTEYKSNCPFYLSQQHIFQTNPLDADLVETTRYIQNQGELRSPFISTDVRSDERPNLTGFLLEGETLAVTSDGIHTFSQCQDGITTEPDWAIMLDELTNFKGANVGPFVERRFQMFNRKAKREGISHYDDLSIAAIHYF